MNIPTTQNHPFELWLHRIRLQRGLAFGTIILAALIAFEIFNYSTTEFALMDLLGDLNFLGISWSTILAIAFCGIDFAGIARLFTPEEGENELNEVWYLFGAWLLAATMNAMLTWWGVSIAILNHTSSGSAVVPRESLLRIAPIFVAVLVWLIRVLIIGTFSVAGNRLFSQADQSLVRSRGTLLGHSSRSRSSTPSSNAPTNTRQTPAPSFKPSLKPIPPTEGSYSRPEPSYHPAALNANPSSNINSPLQRQ